MFVSTSYNVSDVFANPSDYINSDKSINLVRIINEPNPDVKIVLYENSTLNEYIFQVYREDDKIAQVFSTFHKDELEDTFMQAMDFAMFKMN